MKKSTHALGRRLAAALVTVGIIGGLGTAVPSAHEGQLHVLMGTVTMAAADHLMLRTVEGRELTVQVNERTPIRSAAPITNVQDITAGTRVVVTAKENKPKIFTAELVRVGTSASPARQAPAGDRSAEATIATWLGQYDAAFNAKDLAKLGAFYHPDVTIYEGAGINNGWADYRDNHLGPELNAFQNPQLIHRDLKVTLLPGDRSAYVTSRYTLTAKTSTRDVDAEGLATYVLVKAADGTWQIRHSHTSSRPRRPRP